MGGSSWSKSDYDDRAAVRSSRVASGGAPLAYDHAVRTGATAKECHKDMDPKLVAGPTSPYAGKVMRESRDSDVHPESVAVAVFFDQTGSMGDIPVTLEKKLAGLMALILQKGYAKDPQILFGAIGDARTGYGMHGSREVAPLQVGQFESGIEMDDVMDKIYLEGNGGGQNRESYDLALYFAAKHFSADCWEKRQHKGYLFIVGDEGFYEDVLKENVTRLIGDPLEGDLRTVDIVKDLQERWHVFHVRAVQGSVGKDPTVTKQWKDLLGERLLMLNDADNVAELIGATIGLTEGATDIDGAMVDLKTMGIDANGIKSVSMALATYAKSTGIVAKSDVDGTLPQMVGGGGTARI